MKHFYFLSFILLWLPIGLIAQSLTTEEQNEIGMAQQQLAITGNFFPELTFENPEMGVDGIMEDFIPAAGATETFTPAVGDFFYDTGGQGGGGLNPSGGPGTELDGNYLNCTCVTTTTLAGVTEIEFHEFEIFGNFDWLKVYDGADTTGTVLYDSNTNGNTDTYAGMIALNGSGVFTGTSGSITFEFNATGVVDDTGWEVEILTVDGGDPEDDDLLVIDLTTENQITITATSGASAGTVSGSTTTGFYFENLFASAGTQAIGTTSYVGTPTLTAASVTTDNSPVLFRSSNTDPGMNIYSYSATSPTTFTTGSQAFTGAATWDISADLYNALLTAPASGNVYFPADDVSDLATATLLGTYTVILPGGTGGCEWTVSVFGGGLGDEVSWEFRDSGGNVLLSGGPYSDSPYSDTQTVTADEPVEFYIESMGSWNDNTPAFTIANGNGVIINSSISGGTEATYSGLLCSTPPIPTPVNDNCGDVTPTTLTNGTPVTFTGTTEGATGSPEEIGVLGYAAVWEAVTLTGDCNNLTVDYCGTTPGVMNGNMFIVYTDSCPVSDFVVGTYDWTTCSDGNGTIRFYNLPAGTYYLPVIVDTTLNTLGEYTMNVVSVDCPPPPANDDCENAIALSCGDSDSGTTLSASDSGGNPAPDVFYSFTGSGTPEMVTVSLCGSFYDTYLRVFSDCTLSNEIASNDDSCGLQSELTFLSDGTSTYIIMVEGYDINAGEYVINLSCSEPPGPVDPCAPVHEGVANSGVGFSGGYSSANDFDVLAGTQFAVQKITIDMVTLGGNPTTFDLSFFEGNTGVETQYGESFPGITPTGITPNGLLFGVYPIYTVELTLPSPQVFPATADADKKYWVAISAGLDDVGNYTYWVASEYVADTLPMWQNDGSSWFEYVDDLGSRAEGFMSIEGECEQLGISDMNSFNFTYYPNPVKDYLNIESQKAVESISAFNLAGQKVLSDLKLAEGKVDMSYLSPGTYIFRVTLQGGQIETFKIIKK